MKVDKLSQLLNEGRSKLDKLFGDNDIITVTGKIKDIYIASNNDIEVTLDIEELANLNAIKNGTAHARFHKSSEKGKRILKLKNKNIVRVDLERRADSFFIRDIFDYIELPKTTKPKVDID